jgi:hypothetical protein
MDDAIQRRRFRHASDGEQQAADDVTRAALEIRHCARWKELIARAL